MTGILDLPEEIRPFIGKFLDKKAIQACLLVSRSFHRSFEPLLWQKVIIYNPTDEDKKVAVVGIDALRARTRDVQNYVIHNKVSLEFYDLIFPHLRRLQLTDKGLEVESRASRGQEDNSKKSHADIILAQTKLVRSNPTVQNLVVASLPATPSAAFWSAICTTWTQPKILHVTGPVATDPEAGIAFWQACTLFSEISLIRITVESTIPSLLTFHRIQKLKIQSSYTYHRGFFSIPQQLALIIACPQLKHLIWNVVMNKDHIKEFRNALAQNHWPLLKNLELENMYSHGGKEFATLLQDLPALTSLRFRYCQLTSHGFKILKKRQFESLTTLKLHEGCGITSKMTLEVLTECVNLEVFRSTHIYAGHVDPQTPWVCKRLRVFTVCILHRETNPNRAALDLEVYKQLARLTNLVRLDLSQYSMGHRTTDPEFHLMDAMNTLDIRLKAGLGELSALTKIRFIGFGNSFQITGEAEILWMLEHWKNLKTVVGQLDSFRRSEALRAMTLRGVDYRHSGVEP
ncbi:hypothetical protein FBU30_001140 [Linnemannia zychae]|nr:hypothetical protein FBU30_001140 [Linnemannia zychae]